MQAENEFKYVSTPLKAVEMIPAWKTNTFSFMEPI